MKTCDLHTHSIFSDGTWTPTQLVREAERLGLGAVALTDHNTVDGLPEFLEAGSTSSVETVPGIEFSSDYHGTDVHILGYFIKPEDYDGITQLLAQMQQRKDLANAQLAENLTRAGYCIDYEALKAATPHGSVNRAHFATELTRRGYTRSNREAFDRLLNPSCGYYQPPKRMTPFEAIAYIKSIGAVAVSAHPLLTLQPEQAYAFLKEAVRYRLDGMETHYVTYDEKDHALALSMAGDLGLLCSGGSDFHADNKPDIRMGVGRGGLCVPLSLLDGLKRHHRILRKI